MTTPVIVTSYVNATEGRMIGEETYPVADSIIADSDNPMGDLYRFGLGEYGRCTGKVYVDRAGDGPAHVGYVFQSRDQYQDSDETYLREVWMCLADETPAIPARLSFPTAGAA